MSLIFRNPLELWWSSTWHVGCGWMNLCSLCLWCLFFSSVDHFWPTSFINHLNSSVLLLPAPPWAAAADSWFILLRQSLTSTFGTSGFQAEVSQVELISTGAGGYLDLMWILRSGLCFSQMLRSAAFRKLPFELSFLFILRKNKKKIKTPENDVFAPSATNLISSTFR